MSVLPAVLEGDVLERMPDYRSALLGLSPEVLPDGVPDLIRIYRSTKDLAFRNKILKVLAACDRPELAEFFVEAYARERYHSMKVFAIRGLAQFASEQDIARRLAGLRGSLRKVEQSTPLNFVEYEVLLGPFSLPYLVERYGYASLRQTLAQVKGQYERMPDAVKGLVTTNEFGDVVEPVAQQDYRQRVDEAIAEVRARTSGEVLSSSERPR